MVDHFAHENDIGLAILLLAPHGLHPSVSGNQTGIKNTSTCGAGSTYQDYCRLYTITESRLYLRRSGTGTNTKVIHLDKLLAGLQMQVGYWPYNQHTDSMRTCANCSLHLVLPATIIVLQLVSGQHCEEG